LDETILSKQTMKKILITGASGFIGSFLAEKALEEGMDTWAGVRQTSKRDYLQDDRLRLIDLNLADKERLKEQIFRHVAQEGPWDYVIHNAGITKGVSPDDFERVNYRYSENLITALQESGNIPEKFLFMSSLSAHHPDVHTKYGDSKRKVEQLLQSQVDFPYIILCPTGVYGPREKDYYLALKMLQSGWDITVGFKPQRLSFIYVKDLAKAAFLSLESPVSNKTYFLSDGDTYSDEEYTYMAKTLLGKKRIIRLRIPLRVLWVVSVIAEWMAGRKHKSSTLNRDKYEIMKQRDWKCNIFPIVKELGFYADYPLRRGLEESIQWYRANGWL
jgi:nucleoside-diphosphate-sugar epimerase